MRTAPWGETGEPSRRRAIRVEGAFVAPIAHDQACRSLALSSLLQPRLVMMIEPVIGARASGNPRGEASRDDR